jgi:Flp pilus assembly protein TadD
MSYFKWIVLILAAGLLAGCHSKAVGPQTQYQTMAQDPNRDSQAAREHNAQGVLFLKEGKLKEAEAAFKAALASDPFCGPAHNNLGNVYHKQEDFYQAAWEFQYASKLMPYRSEPRNNLGLVMEEVGKLDDAAQWYEAALEIDPQSPQYVGNLARVYVQENRRDQKTRDLLQQLVMNDTRPEWVDWAREQLALMPKTQNEP